MKKGRLLVVLFVLALIILYVIIYVVPKMQGILENTTVLEYGTLPVTDSGEALIVRDETLFSAASEGRLKYKISESSKVRKGIKIVDLESGKVSKKDFASENREGEKKSKYEDIISKAGKNIKVSENNTANISGVVSYHVDGYEKILTPKTIKDLDGEKIKEINPEVIDIKRDSTLKGDPIYKLAKNTLWYLVVWKDKDEDIKNYEENKNVKIDIDNTQVDAKVNSIHEKDGGNLIVLETDMYYKNYSKFRKIQISVIFAEYQGLIVKNDSIVTEGKDTENEKNWVYVKQRDDSYEQVPVNILATSGEYSVLSVKRYYDEEGLEVNTVNYYEEILTNPEKHKEKSG